MAYADPLVIVPSGARTTNGDAGYAVPCDKGLNLSLMVEATALSGTPSLTISVQWSMDGINFAVVDTTGDAFAAITTTPTRVIKTFPVKAPYFKPVWAISGATPSITFQVSKYVAGD